jgi:hypothetical protein
MAAGCAFDRDAAWLVARITVENERVTFGTTVVLETLQALETLEARATCREALRTMVDDIFFRMVEGQEATSQRRQYAGLWLAPHRPNFCLSRFIAQLGHKSVGKPTWNALESMLDKCSAIATRPAQILQL